MSTVRKIYEVVSNWENTGEMTNEMAQIIMSGFDDFMKKELDQISSRVKKGRPHQAFGQLNRLFAIVNMIFMEYPYAYLSFDKWINMISKILEAIVKHKEFNAREPRIQISIGIPHGFSITISYGV